MDKQSDYDGSDLCLSIVNLTNSINIVNKTCKPSQEPCVDDYRSLTPLALKVLIYWLSETCRFEPVEANCVFLLKNMDKQCKNYSAAQWSNWEIILKNFSAAWKNLPDDQKDLPIKPFPTLFTIIKKKYYTKNMAQVWQPTASPEQAAISTVICQGVASVTSNIGENPNWMERVAESGWICPPGKYVTMTYDEALSRGLDISHTWQERVEKTNLEQGYKLLFLVAHREVSWQVCELDKGGHEQLEEFLEKVEVNFRESSSSEPSTATVIHSQSAADSALAEEEHELSV